MNKKFYIHIHYYLVFSLLIMTMKISRSSRHASVPFQISVNPHIVVLYRAVILYLQLNSN